MYLVELVEGLPELCGLDLCEEVYHVYSAGHLCVFTLDSLTALFFLLVFFSLESKDCKFLAHFPCYD
jgi:hypothetical protein